MKDEVMIKKCLDVIDVVAQQALESEDFLELRPEAVKAIISRDTLRVDRETDVWQACVRWAESECQRQGKPVSFIGKYDNYHHYSTR